jgi:hypothetical protein
MSRVLKTVLRHFIALLLACAVLGGSILIRYCTVVLADTTWLNPVVIFPLFGFTILYLIIVVLLSVVPMSAMLECAGVRSSKAYWGAAVLFPVMLLTIPFTLQVFGINLDWRLLLDQRNILMERETIERVFHPLSAFSYPLFWSISAGFGFVVYWPSLKKIESTLADDQHPPAHADGGRVHHS